MIFVTCGKCNLEPCMCQHLDREQRKARQWVLEEPRTPKEIDCPRCKGTGRVINDTRPKFP